MAILGQQFFTILEMDKEFAFKLSDILKESTTELLEQLLKAIKDADKVQAKTILHTIKGSAANFGADELMQKTKEVESVIHLLSQENISDYIEQLNEIISVFNQTFTELEKYK